MWCDGECRFQACRIEPEHCNSTITAKYVEKRGKKERPSGGYERATTSRDGECCMVITSQETPILLFSPGDYKKPRTNLSRTFPGKSDLCTLLIMIRSRSGIIDIVVALVTSSIFEGTKGGSYADL